MEAIEHPPIFRLPGIPDHVTYTWLVMVILAALTFVASRNMQLVPRGLQNFFEVVLEQFQQMIDDVMGHEGRKYLPLIATLGLFILTANLMSLVPGLVGPTSNLNTNGACALIVFLAYHWIGVRKQGLLAYLKHFAGPVPLPLKPLMFVIEVISHLARPLSLTLRLFGNMVGGHILLAVIFLLMGLNGLIGWALAAGLCGLGQGRAVASAVDAMARQPGAAARIQTAMIIGLALIESLAIYTLVIALILLFVKGINFA